jgi:pilus assembly protein CpaB
MRPKSLALLLLALGCGLVASIGITRVMTRGNGESDGAETNGVFVATADIGMGDMLTPELFKVEVWPKDKTPPGAISRAEDAEGRRTRGKIYAGELILDNKLFAKGSSQQGAAANIPNDYRLATIRVDAVTGGGSMILPGDRVDVMLHTVADANRGIPESLTRTILQNIKVFAVNDVWSNDKDKEGNRTILAKTISLLTTPKEAGVIMAATQMGTVNLLPRGTDDNKRAADVEVRQSELLGVSTSAQQEKQDKEAARAPVVNLPVAAAVPPPVDMPPPRPTWTMQVLTANEAGDVVLEEQPSGLWKVVAGAASTAASPPKDDPKLAAPLVPEQPEPVKPEQPHKPHKSNEGHAV